MARTLSLALAWRDEGANRNKEPQEQEGNGLPAGSRGHASLERQSVTCKGPDQTMRVSSTQVRGGGDVRSPGAAVHASSHARARTHWSRCQPRVEFAQKPSIPSQTIKIGSKLPDGRRPTRTQNGTARRQTQIIFSVNTILCTSSLGGPRKKRRQAPWRRGTEAYL